MLTTRTGERREYMVRLDKVERSLTAEAERIDRLYEVPEEP